MNLKQKPFECSACGGALPLGNGRSVHCPYCGATTEVPHEYQELRAALSHLTAERQAAEALYRRLGHPPTPLVETVTFLAGGAVAAVTAVAEVLLAIGGLSYVAFLFGLEVLLHALAPVLGVDLVDVLGGGRAYALVGCGFLGTAVIALTGMRLGEMARRRLELQGGMAAGPPARDGGPASCRSCGAALDVPAEALGVRCLYCGSDNLVALPAAYVQACKKFEKGFRHQITDISAAEKRERDEFGSNTGVLVVVGFAGVGLMWLAGTAATFFDNDEVMPPRWGDSPRQWVPAHNEDGVYNNVVQQRPATFAFGAREQVGGRLQLRYFVAMHRGESLLLTSPDFKDTVEVVYSNTTTFPWVEHRQGGPLQHTRQGDWATYHDARYTGWVVVELVAPTTAMNQNFEFTWQITTPATAHAYLTR